MSKYILDVNLSFDFELIGIASALPGYRVAWLLNTKLSLKLSRIKDIIIKLDDPVVTGELSFDNVHQKERRFSRYVYEIEEEEVCIELISYKCQGHLLNPELKGFDFILKIEAPEELADEYILKLKDIEAFNLVRKIDVENSDLDFLSSIQEEN